MKRIDAISAFGNIATVLARSCYSETQNIISTRARSLAWIQESTSFLFKNAELRPRTASRRITGVP